MPVSQTSATSAFERIRVLREKRRQRRRADLLLALEQDRDLAGRPAELGEGAAGLDEGHQLTFVVGRASRRRSASRSARLRASARRAGCAKDSAGPAAARRNGHRRARAGRRGRPAFMWATTAGRPAVGCFETSKPMAASSATSQSAALSQSGKWAGTAEIEGIFKSSKSRSSAGVCSASIAERTSSMVAIISPQSRRIPFVGVTLSAGMDRLQGATKRGASTFVALPRSPCPSHAPLYRGRNAIWRSILTPETHPSID